MNQAERREFLIRRLIEEEPRYRGLEIPAEEAGQRRLLRSLLNVRLPGEIGEDFLRVQDAYLQQVTTEKGVTALEALRPLEPDLYLWQGDITALAVDAIVNAANSGMTGCYQPCHNCIDNCIHTYAGVQLRSACAGIMARQGHEEPAGQAKITPGFNLPCRWVIHTVGPIVQGQPTKKQEAELASCYRACLALAAENGCRSIAFCCISTGVFGFPRQRAAEIAVETVRAWKAETGSGIAVVFNVFRENNYNIYRALLN